MPKYIFDTTVLSNLAAAGRLELLKGRYRNSAFTTVEVSDELRKGLQAGYTYLEAALKQIEGMAPGGWLRVLVPDSAAEQRLRAEFDLVLGPGEASSLALASSRGLALVSDDLAARRLAEEREVPLTGTLGILITLVRDGTLTLAEANDLLATMIERRYRSPVERLDELI